MRAWTRFAAWAMAALLFVGAAFAAQAGLDTKEEVEIVLDSAGSRASGAGVRVEGNMVAVRAAGTYRVRGSLDGQLVVAVDKNDEVTLVLDGVELTNATEAALLVENAGRTTIRLAEGSVNRVQSGEPVELSADAAETDASGGALHAKDDLTIEGPGALEVLGYVNNGIHCANRLVIAGGDVRVEALNNGVKGKDGVTVSGGNLTIHSGGDGVDSDSEDGEGFGEIEFAGGSVSIESFGDGAQAATALTVSGGELTVVSGGGSAAVPDQSAQPGGRGENWDRDEESDAPSAKGLKAGTLLSIRGGGVTIDAADDALHSDGEMIISGGTLELATGDDGAHADDRLTVSDGALRISSSYEGMEANQILISGGTLDVSADDDGINANGGAFQLGGFGGRGGFGMGGGKFGGRGGVPNVSGEEREMPEGFAPNGRMDEAGGELPAKMGDKNAPGENREMPEGFAQDDRVNEAGGEPPARMEDKIPEEPSAEEESLPVLRITGGSLRVDAEGDGLDSNGNLIIEGGEIVVDGPSRSGNGALDSGSESGGACLVNGGTILAIGASGMAESFDGASEQCSFRHTFEQELPAGSEITVTDADGNALVEHTAAKSFSSVVFSCPELTTGESYVLTAGDERVEITMDAAAVESGAASRWRW